MHQTIELSAGTIRYRDRGTGPVVLLVHGLLVDSRLWDAVAEPLSVTHRVVQPDLPLGAHRVPMHPDADLTPRRIAELVIEFMKALDLKDVTIVGNDTGGAIVQLAVTTDASRVARMVLTTCDAFDVFPPKQFAYLRLVGRFRALAWLTGQSMRFNLSRRLPIAYGGLSQNSIPSELTADWVLPMRTSAAIRRDLAKVLRSIGPTDTMVAGAALAEFDRPTLLVWGRSDRFFPARLAEQLGSTLPDARIDWVDDTSTFVPLDQPGHLTNLIADHVAAGHTATT